MVTPNNNDWLDAMLAQQKPMIEDDGFSERVLAALPPPKRSPRFGRTLIIMAFTAVASGLVAFVLPTRTLITTSFQDIEMIDVWTALHSASAAATAVLMILLVTAATVGVEYLDRR